MIRPVTSEILNDLLRYESETGLLFWKRRGIGYFQSKNPQHGHAVWNAKYANQPAFTSIGSDGYYRGGVFKRKLLAHRVIWTMVHGDWPKDQIDHINGVRSDNRLINLRSVSRLENMKNQKLPSDNKSGCPGVTWFAQTRRWQVQITVEGRVHNLGYFKDLSDAIEKRKLAERQFGFHPNHGRSL